MAVVMVDTALVLYTYLAGYADFAANGFTVYGPPGLPANFAGGKALVFWSDGGVPHDNLPIFYDRVQFRAYGNTVADARLGTRVLADALSRRAHTRVTTGGKTYQLQYAELESGPRDMREPDTRWFFSLAYYRVHIYERAVT